MNINIKFKSLNKNIIHANIKLTSLANQAQTISMKYKTEWDEGNKCTPGNPTKQQQI